MPDIYDQYTYSDTRQDASVTRDTSVEVITAVPLTVRQLQQIEVRLIRMLKSHVNLKLTVDPDLLGGVRIVTDRIVIDDSIKRKLFDMKQSITEKVFSED